MTLFISCKIYIKAPSMAASWDTFVKPFSTPMWVVLGFAILVVAAATFAFYRIVRKIKGDSKEELPMGTCVFIVYHSFVQQGLCLNSL